MDLDDKIPFKLFSHIIKLPILHRISVLLYKASHDWIIFYVTDCCLFVIIQP